MDAPLSNICMALSKVNLLSQSWKGIHIGLATAPISPPGRKAFYCLLSITGSHGGTFNEAKTDRHTFFSFAFWSLEQSIFHDHLVRDCLFILACSFPCATSRKAT